MSQLELIAELRAARPVASPELRSRVHAVASRAPARPRFRLPAVSVPRRRLAFALASAAAVAVAASAVVAGLVGSLSSGEHATAPAPVRNVGPAGSKVRDTVAPVAGRTKEAAPTPSVPAAKNRTQLYAAEMRLRVHDLSRATKTLLRLTRGYGGYVRSVDYGSGSEYGTALVVVRIPIGSVQAAIVRFSDLGTILDQHVAIRDIQAGVDARFKRMQAIRAEIARLQKQPQSADHEARIARLQAELVALQKEQAAVRKQASFATVSVGLTTKEPAAALPAKPGRLQRALDHAGGILVRELVVVVYVLVVAGPLFLLGLLALAGERARRRRSTERLLGTR